MKTIKAKVIMLPTEGNKLFRFTKNVISSGGGLFTDGKRIGKSHNHDINLKQQHLYITTDEEIKEGDWFTNGKLIYKNEIQLDGYIGVRKIIATTDPKLTTLIAGGGEGNAGAWRLLPQVQESFIKEFCEAGGIYDVEVEMEEVGQRCSIHQLSKEECNQCDMFSPGKSQLKVNSDNAINIHSAKDSWTREEVEKLIIKAWKQGGKDRMTKTYNGPEEWIKQNL